jgi:DNA polymerase III epsilon subunit-like protein
MKYCIFDTETTGLPETPRFLFFYPPSSLKRYENARVLQLAWKIVEDNDNISENNDENIKKTFNNLEENNIYISYDKEITNSHIHHITSDVLKEHGKPIEEVLEKFKKSVEDVDVLVGHNVDFDIYILQSEFIRAGIKCDLLAKKRYCTMKISRNILKLPGKFGDYKYPRLSELYSHYFGNPKEGAHNAIVDVEMCLEAFWKLKNL